MLEEGGVDEGMAVDEPFAPTTQEDVSLLSRLDMQLFLPPMMSESSSTATPKPKKISSGWKKREKARGLKEEVRLAAMGV